MLLVLFAVPATAAEAPELNAKSAIVINLETGKTVFEKAADEEVSPSASVKMLTALTVVELVEDLKTPVTVTKSALRNTEGKTVGLKENEVLPAEDLLACLVVASANDAASVLAEHAAGSISEFMNKANQLAQKLGCTHTHFSNPHGLDDSNHYTTARDMGLIAVAFAKNETLLKLSSTPRVTIAATEKSAERLLTTGNHLISRYINANYYYSPAQGMCSGMTTKGGYVAASMVSKNGLSYVAVVMGASKSEDGLIQSFVDLKNLFEWVVPAFEMKTVVTENSPIEEINVKFSATNDHIMLVPQNEIKALLPTDMDPSKLTRETETGGTVEAPVEKGQVLGSAVYFYDGERIGSVNLVANTAIERSEVLHFIDKLSTFMQNSVVVGGMIALVALLFIYIVLTIVHSSRRKRNNRRRRRRPRY